MQEALQFRADTEALDGPDFVAQARALRRQPVTSHRGLALTIRALRKSFGDHEVLRGIDLHIPAEGNGAGITRLQARDQAEQRALAAATAPDDSDELAGGDVQVVAAQHLVVAEGFA